MLSDSSRSSNIIPIIAVFMIAIISSQVNAYELSHRKRLRHGDCPMFRRFYVQKVLCSENICSKGSMFRRSYIQKVLCSEGPMFSSEGPMFRKYLLKRSYIQKVLCLEGPIFRYIQKVLYSENSLFYVGKNLHLSVSGKLQCNLITNHSVSF